MKYLASIFVFCLMTLPACAWTHGSTVLTIPQSAALVAVFDASAINGVSCNAQFGTWTDSINSIAAAQATGAKQPTYLCNQVGSFPAVSFPGSNYLTIATPGALQTAIDSQTYTVFVVFETTGSKSTGTLFGAVSGGNSLYMFADGTNVGRFNNTNMAYSGQSAFSTLFVSCSASFSLGSAPILEMFGINGGAVYNTVGGGSCPTSGGSTFAIGAHGDGTLPVNAKIFKIYVWNQFLTPPQQLQMQAYIDNLYGQPTPWSTRTAFVAYAGDSITDGLGHTVNASNIYPAVASASLGLSFGQWANLGIGGINMVNQASLAPTWTDPIPKQLGIPEILVAFNWANQAGASPTPYNNSAAYLAARKLVANVYTVWGTSTDDAFDNETQRANYNTAFDNAPTLNIDAYVPLHTDPKIGLTTAQANFPTYWSDGLHLSNLGYGVMAGLFVTGIQTLPVQP